MSVKTVATREFDCDRCCAADVFINDAVAAAKGWTILTVNGREVVLCPVDRNRLDRFLMGQKTPAGQRFNADEGNRMLDYATVPREGECAEEVGRVQEVGLGGGVGLDLISVRAIGNAPRAQPGGDGQGTRGAGLVTD